MNSRFLGKSGLLISEIGMGCMSLKSTHPKLASEMISKAKDGGINYFDTADLYDKGLNETIVGQAVHSFRQQILLGSKVGNQWRSDGSGWDWKASRPFIIKQAEKSLSRLKTDYLDLYMLHGGMIEDPVDEIIQAFELLKKEGKIRSYGISSIRPNVIREYVQKSAIDVVMMQYSVLDRRLEEQINSLLVDHQISILARGSIAKGMLVDKPAEPYLQYTSGEVQHIIRNLQLVAARHQVSAYTLALSFVLTNKAVASSVVGIGNLAQMDNLLKVKNELLKLSSEDLQTLQEGVRSVFYTEHR